MDEINIIQVLTCDDTCKQCHPSASQTRFQTFAKCATSVFRTDGYTVLPPPSGFDSRDRDGHETSKGGPWFEFSTNSKMPDDHLAIMIIDSHQSRADTIFRNPHLQLRFVLSDKGTWNIMHNDQQLLLVVVWPPNAGVPTKPTGMS